MVSSTRTRRRTPASFVAIGLPPSLVAPLLDRLGEEGATPVRVAQSEEGTAMVFFQLAPWDNGAWLTSLAQSFGCGLAPCAVPA